jgi:CheY-like chemotaxis protein
MRNSRLLSVWLPDTLRDKAEAPMRNRAFNALVQCFSAIVPLILFFMAFNSSPLEFLWETLPWAFPLFVLTIVGRVVFRRAGQIEWFFTGIFFLSALMPWLSVPSQGLAPLGMALTFTGTVRLLQPRYKAYWLMLLMQLSFLCQLPQFTMPEMMTALRYLLGSVAFFLLFDFALVTKRLGQAGRVSAMMSRLALGLCLLFLASLVAAFWQQDMASVLLNTAVVLLWPLWLLLRRWFNPSVVAVVVCVILVVAHMIALFTLGQRALAFAAPIYLLLYVLLPPRFFWGFFVVMYVTDITFLLASHEQLHEQLLFRQGLSMLLVSSMLVLVQPMRRFLSRGTQKSPIEAWWQPDIKWRLLGYFILCIMVILLLAVPLLLLAYADRAVISLNGLLLLYCLLSFAAWVAWLAAHSHRQEKAILAYTEAARQASQAKQQFMSNMSHEMRTPLNGILGMIQVLKFELDLSPKQQEYVQLLHRAGDSLHRLVEDTLDMTRIERGKFALSREPFMLNDCLQALQQQLEDHAPAIAAKVRVQDRLPSGVMLHSDKDRLIQALDIVIRDMLSSEAVAALDVEVSLEEGKIVLSFKQQGPRWQDSQRDAWQQWQAPSDSRVGLSIAFEIFKQMDATFNIAAHPVAGVNLHRLILPLAFTMIRDQASQWAPLPRRQLSSLAEAMVLVVDDDGTNRLVMQMGLSPHVAKVFLAENAEQALQLLEQQPVDVVLSDISMPGMGGEALLDTLAERQPDLPVMAFTGNASPQDIAYYHRIGFAGVAAKPVVFEALIQKIQRILLLS